MCDKRVGYAVNDRLLRLGVRANLALGIWVDAEEALVVQLPLTGAAADWLWLFLLLHLWCVAANLTCLCEGAVDFTHVRKGRPQPTTALKKLIRGRFVYRCFTMLFCLLWCGRAASIFDIVAPILTSEPGETGFWSLLGVATNMKSSIRFSPDSSRQNGAICQRIPIESTNWSLEFRTRVGLGSLLFLMTEETCPYLQITNGLESWTGFGINMSAGDDGVTLTGTYLTASNQTVHTLCNVSDRDFEVRVERSGNLIHVSTKTSGNYSTCGSAEVTISPSVFFSFIATSPDGIGDSEVFHLNASENEEQERTEGFLNSRSEISRQEIWVQQERLNAVKPVLPLAEAVIARMEEAMYVLEKGDSSNTTKEIKEILGEIRGRIGETMSVRDLQQLIQATLAVNLMKIERKMEKRREAFLQIANDLETLKGGIDEKVKWLGAYVANAMAEAKKDAVDTLAVFLKLTKESKKFKTDAKSMSMDMRSNALPMFLYIIAFIELVCYLAFFFVQRAKTHRFKKYD